MYFLLHDEHNNWDYWLQPPLEYIVYFKSEHLHDIQNGEPKKPKECEIGECIEKWTYKIQENVVYKSNVSR